MDFQEVVRRRRMVRSFDPNRTVPPAVLERVLTNATHAPSAGFSQGWAFVVLEGVDETERFWRHTYDPDWRPRPQRRPGRFAAPVLVVCLCSAAAYTARYAEPDKAGLGLDRPEGWPVPFWQLDTAMAALLMLLTATDESLGALWFGVFRGEDALTAELGVPAGWDVVGAVALGYPAGDDPPSPSLRRGRRPVSEVVHRGRW